jgi:hypothetical protein
MMMGFARMLLSLLAALLLGATGTAGALAQDATPAPGAPADAMLTDTFGLPELQISFDGSTFSGVPAETAAGWTVITFTNNSSDFGAVGFIQLPEGQTVETAFPAPPPDGDEPGLASPEGMEEMDMASPAAGGEDPFAWLYETYIAGGVGGGPGQTVQGIVDLRPGNYAVWPDDPSVPVAPVPLTVTGDAAVASPTASGITADVTVTEIDSEQGFDFQVSGTAVAGPALVEVRNDSTQPHFLTTIVSSGPITEDQVAQLLATEEGGTPPAGLPDPATLAEGFYAAVQSADTVQYVAVNLDAGYYVAMCFVPDPNAGGIPHAFEGMIEVFEVTA